MLHIYLWSTALRGNMGNYLEYVSINKLNEYSQRILGMKRLPAGKDRFTRKNLREAFKVNDFLIDYRKKLLEGYYPRKYKIYRLSTFDLKSEENSKVNVKIRLVCNPSILDRIAFLSLKDYLTSLRTSKNKIVYSSVSSIASSLVDQLNDLKPRDNMYLIKLDIQSFFDSIDVDELFHILDKDYRINVNAMSFLKNTIEVYRKSFDFNDSQDTKTVGSDSDFPRVINKEFTIDTDIGIPQGLPISSVLSEIFVDGLDKDINKKLRKLGKVRKMYRYVDDIIILLESNKRLQRITTVLQDYQYRKLKFNQKKMKIFPLSKIMGGSSGIDFLGYNLYLGHDMKYGLRISKTRLVQIINGIEKRFSDVGIKMEKLNNSSMEKRLRRRKIVSEIVRFHAQMDLYITGFYSTTIDSKHQGFGVVHTYKHIQGYDTFKHIDAMINKFKKRINELSFVKLKTMTASYQYARYYERIEKSDSTLASMYIPDLNKLLDSSNEGLLDEFLFVNLYFSRKSLRELPRSEKSKILNEFIHDSLIIEKYIDIERALELYASRSLI